MSRKRRGYLLPAIVDPDRIQFCIEIPNEPNHILAFWGALDELGQPYSWDDDEAHTALAVAAVWREIYEKTRQSFVLRDCLTEEPCRFYRPKSPRLQWFPENPFEPNAEIPTGYLFHPFTVVDSSILSTIISAWGLGYQINDVYTDITKLPAGDWGEIIDDGYLFFPRFRVNDLNGSGKVKIHLLNIPQGGRVLIVKDGVLDLLNLQLVELNKDHVSVPPETQTAIIVEIEFIDEAEHFLDVVFVPNVNDEVIPFFFGGGLRGVEICGFGVETMPEEACCDETNDLLSTNNVILGKILNLMQGGMTADIRFNSSSLSETNFDALIDCTPEQFNESGSDGGDPDLLAKRQKALCLTTVRYVWRVFELMVEKTGIPDDIMLAIEALFGIEEAPYMGEIKVRFPEDFAVGAFLAALIGFASLEDIVCEMISNLENKFNTFSEFKVSLPAMEGENLLRAIVREANQIRGNHTVFARALEKTFMEDLSLYECPCEEPPAGCEIVFVDTIPGQISPTVVTHITGDIYRIQQNTPVGANYYATIEDSTGRCLYIELTADPAYPEGAVSHHTIIGCCGDADSDTVGGFAPIHSTKADWLNGDPIDTYYKITCVDPEDCP